MKKMFRASGTIASAFMFHEQNEPVMNVNWHSNMNNIWIMFWFCQGYAVSNAHFQRVRNDNIDVKILISIFCNWNCCCAFLQYVCASIDCILLRTHSSIHSILQVMFRIDLFSTFQRILSDAWYVYAFYYHL